MPWLLFTHGKEPVPIVQEAGWAPGPVWTGAENLRACMVYVCYRNIILFNTLHHSSTQIVLHGARHFSVC
jgi:hypothetical protein